MTRTIPIGLVGAGFVARVHAEAYAQIPGAEVACVAARRRERAEAFVAETGGGEAAEVADLLARADIEIVDICAPNRLHEELAVAAAAAGVSSSSDSCVNDIHAPNQ